MLVCVCVYVLIYFTCVEFTIIDRNFLGKLFGVFLGSGFQFQLYGSQVFSPLVPIKSQMSLWKPLQSKFVSLYFLLM